MKNLFRTQEQRFRWTVGLLLTVNVVLFCCFVGLTDFLIILKVAGSISLVIFIVALAIWWICKGEIE